MRMLSGLLASLPLLSIVLWVLTVGEERPHKIEFAIFCVLVSVGLYVSAKQFLKNGTLVRKLRYLAAFLINFVIAFEIVRLSIS